MIRTHLLCIGGALLCPADSSNAREAERVPYFDVVEFPNLDINKMTVRADLEGRKVQASVLRQEIDGRSMIHFSVTLEENLLGETSIDANLLPNLDLSTLRFYGDQRKRLTVFMIAKFGSKRHCFTNNDGRSDITVLFSLGEKVRKTITTFVDCEPQYVELN